MAQAETKTAIVVYSRTGHSARLADRLAGALDARVIPLSDPGYGRGFLGYMRAGWHSLRHRKVASAADLPTLAAYDRVVLCGPVWTSYPATPLRSVLKTRDDLPATVAVFLTSGAHSPAKKAFATATRDLGRPLVAVASLPNDKEDTAEEDGIIARFLENLAAATPLARESA